MRGNYPYGRSELEKLIKDNLADRGMVVLKMAYTKIKSEPQLRTSHSS
ncbi:3349_t:CDS:2 [Paraglomus brasilianum]|uniref:3349_t:CDS:1 n=1 Tax=Paraglomus brasilianum TaxID=144538 RepID=A0A9N9G6U3_9GLOM|nr:3349_t:CDS:2 [Paraglomus brasilianum]